MGSAGGQVICSPPWGPMTTSSLGESPPFPAVSVRWTHGSMKAIEVGDSCDQ